MKGNVSRLGFREDRHYSGVFQIQGGLVTDADLGEQATIARNRTDQLGLDSAGSGVPETGGIIDLTGPNPRLVPGTVYAEGVRGTVQAAKAIPNLLSLYGAQKDFPNAPDLPGTGDFFLYADAWERTVTNLEDPLISDAGFHGAETAFRQMTIAQLKFAPLDQLDELGADDGPLPRQGRGLLTATPIDPLVIADDCDPCADTVAADQIVANTLFRIEVVQVHGAPQAPDRIVIAWSAENAAAVARQTVNPEDFERAGAVYEAFSPITDTHLGVHSANDQVARSTFIKKLAHAPNPANGPDGSAWPFVRRWNGKAEIDFGAGTASAIGSGGVAIGGRAVTISTDMLTAQLDFDGRAIVAGDFWLIETRRFADDPIRVVSQTPVGIRHHYCPLLRIKDGTIEALSDAERRRLSFPTLPDIPASHVSFDDPCVNRFGGAENVQQALAALCDIKAEDISFDPSGCPRLYDDVANVQDALSNLCKVDFGIERYLRLMQDWGVICGVVPRRVSTTEVAWSAGSILDRAGNLGDVRAGSIKVAKILADGGNQFASMDALASALAKGEACLALTVETGGVIKPHLVPKNRAFGPADATFMSAFTACRDAKPFYDFKADYVGVATTKKAAIDKVMYAASSDALAGGLSASEEKVARNFTTELVARYKDHIGDDPLAGMLDKRIAEIEEEFDPDSSSGTLREALVLKVNAKIYEAVRETDQERARRCLCDALIPRCPTVGDPPHFVPIACLTGRVDGADVFIDEVCPYCCRKQAMTWRTVQYYVSELRDDIARDLETYCCHQKPRKTKPDLKLPGIIFEKALKPDFDPSMFAKSVTRAVSILGGEEPPTKYKVRPNIRELGVEEATTALAGNGIDVVNTIRAGDRSAVSKLREASSVEPDDLVLDDRSVSPGDKVALIVENGIAVDYIKLDAGGGGKNLFDRPAGAAAAPDVDFEGRADAAIAGFDEKLSVKVAELESAGAGFDEALNRRRDEITSATADLSRIGESRAGVAAEVESLRNDITRLRAERETIARDISSAAGELDRVRTVHNDVNREVASVKAELTSIVELQRTTLADAARERDSVVNSIRRETPVTAVVGPEADFNNALVNRGVTNLGGLAGMTDADLEAAARESRLNVSTARRLRREAEARLGAPIR